MSRAVWTRDADGQAWVDEREYQALEARVAELVASELEAQERLRVVYDERSEAWRRVAELEEALHDIASRTWNIQYDTGVVRQTVQFAGGIHDIARRAVEPPVTKGENAG